MAASSLVVNSINPNLYILGDNQKLFFSDPTSNFSWISNFNPVLNVPAVLKIGIFNFFNNGYVFEHLTTTADNFGTLKLKSILNNNPVELLSINNNIFTFNIPVIVPNPTLNDHAANKYYIDNKVFDLTSNTSGQLSISRLSGYPSNSSLFLRGDGTWAAGNSGTVTSVSISGSAGLSVSGSPITANGTINLTLASELQALSTFVQTGLTARTGSGIYAGRTITASTGISISNGDGILGNPVISVSTIPISNLSGYPGNSSLFLRGDGQWTTAGGGGDLTSNSINVNTSGGNTNWIKRSLFTQGGVQIYGLSSTSYMLESTTAESAGIGFDGYADQCTIWTAGDSGSFLNIQDEDLDNSRAAYVATNGAWTQVSSKKRKHSIKIKNNNNVLDRFLKLSVKSYGYKYEVKDNYTQKQKNRIEKKLNKMATGLILEELFKIFPNCIPDYYNKLFEDKRNKDLILEEELKEPENSGIDYNTLMCYFIMAFQEYVNKTDNLILDLQNKVNNKKI